MRHALIDELKVRDSIYEDSTAEPRHLHETKHCIDTIQVEPI